MIQLTEPQVWVLIGVFATSMFGMLRMTHRSFTDLLRSEMGGLRAEMSSEFSGLRAEMNARFESQAKAIAHLDRDVQTLFRRVFPEYPEAN